MIIAAIGLVGLGLLIVAPRLHRRSLARAERRAESLRRVRRQELEERATVETVVIEPPLARAIQRQLLLRGVRTYLDVRDGRTELVYDAEYADLVDEIRRANENS